MSKNESNLSHPQGFPRRVLNRTFTAPSNYYFGNYEGDITMFRGPYTSSPRKINYSSLSSYCSDSDEEYTNLTRFDEPSNTLETLRNRLFLYELSPTLSNVILKSTFYQKLIQINTILIFITALIVLSSFDIAKRVLKFVHCKRFYLYYWINYLRHNLAPISGSLVVMFIFGYCYYICFRSSYEIVNLIS
ncbi:uncharacterized protein LOC129945234 [Eupeodes corollae]|uniref:uncharacterized protein LOC129945234 n=1 Tax=Eupeodes corollae TaxID=290404 RepID=UPI002491DB3E|nr:uncharacterized protein LOC129945234 [Eupeodes corollae]